jgi:hypothetical protein
VRKHDEKRALVREYKDRPCADYGQTYPHYVMDLDHRRDKLEWQQARPFCVSNMVTNLGIARLREELVKCDVVCSNCHRIRTHERSAGKYTRAY